MATAVQTFNCMQQKLLCVVDRGNRMGGEGRGGEACCVMSNWPKTNFVLQIVVTCAQTAPKESVQCTEGSVIWYLYMAQVRVCICVCVCEDVWLCSSLALKASG